MTRAPGFESLLSVSGCVTSVSLSFLLCKGRGCPVCCRWQESRKGSLGGWVPPDGGEPLCVSLVHVRKKQGRP